MQAEVIVIPAASIASSPLRFFYTGMEGTNPNLSLHFSRFDAVSDELSLQRASRCDYLYLLGCDGTPPWRLSRRTGVCFVLRTRPAHFLWMDGWLPVGLIFEKLSEFLLCYIDFLSHTPLLSCLHTLAILIPTSVHHPHTALSSRWNVDSTPPVYIEL